MNIHSLLSKIIKPFRKKRMNKFIEVMQPNPEDLILDIGGTIYNWQLIKHQESITLLNLNIPKNTNQFSDRYVFVKGDGTNLTYPDNKFKIVFSNSVIEHLHTYKNQKKIAKEARCE